MGPRPARITRDEFLTPPEFGHLAAAGHPAARVGGARIELVYRGGETRLGYCYQQVPIRLMPPLPIDDEPAALVYLITLTAGLMDGDAHLLELTARAGTRSVVTGQSATRVHPALKSHATQQWAVEVEDDACLVVLPGPTIPYAGCRYYQRGRVRLAPTARLIWGDLWMAGRYERGPLSERFAFERIVQDFAVHRGDDLVYRDRFCWNGPWTAEEAAWTFGGELAVGSLFVAGPIPENLASSTSPRLRQAMFPLETGDTAMRWCGPPAAVTAALVEAALRIAGAWSGGPHSPPWLLDSTSLSPNHWFSRPPA